MSYRYPALAHAVIDRIVEQQQDSVDAAVDLIAPRLLSGGLLHVFGTGHARIPVHEMAGRAGGLMAVNLVRLGDLVHHGGVVPAALADPLAERDERWARPLWDLVAPQPGDAFLIASNSGVNGAVVEMATLVREAGLPLVGLTSVRHAAVAPTRHRSGSRLADLADVVIDNGAPPGDAELDLGGGTVVGAVSNLAGVVVVQMLTEGVARRFQDAGRQPAVYRSMNLRDGDASNARTLRTIQRTGRPIEP